ncbi:cytochrome o ubiquinol oxidase subunit IV [Sphingomonas sp. R86521]|uniref:cytochrome o ubiquinol oxidase subunit IV n=1 Tax=Sphingomonas sp. R86521 TaxID=3093860 RepID=UPI0036D3685E
MTDPHASTPAHGDGSAHGEDHAHGDTASHGSRGSYLKGFFLSVFLTAVPFWAVMTGAFKDPSTAVLVVMLFAVVQIVVHMIYFLHMTTKSEGGWTMMALIFTIILVVITMAGSIWVMFHLNSNMMPAAQAMADM